MIVYLLLLTSIINEYIHELQVDLLSSQMSEKLVFHILKFVGGEIEKTRHIGYYANWGHSLMMHHGLWIKRRWREFLPLLNQLQKGLSTKSSDLSEVCDRNSQTVDFLIKLALQLGPPGPPVPERAFCNCFSCFLYLARLF